MNELHFAYRIRQFLNRGAATVDPQVLDRLAQARQAALARQKVASPARVLATLGPDLPERSPADIAKTFLAALALLLGVVSTYYWNKFEAASETEELDTAILADEVPFNAYLDKGFQAWMERASHGASGE